MDANLLGWGAVWNSLKAQGVWTQSESLLPINILELRAIFNALQAWPQLASAKFIRFQSDNITTVAYINQGGTRSSLAMTEVSKIWWAGAHSYLSAIYIPGVDNWEADFLSRQTFHPGEWELHPEVFATLILRWGRPELDLMASRQNAKLQRYGSRSRDPQAELINALVIQPSLCVSTVCSPSPGVCSDQTGEGFGDSHRSCVASQDLVCRSGGYVLSATVEASIEAGPSHSGTLPSSESSFSAADCLEIERLFLSKRGFSDSFIDTLIQARKPVTRKIYYKIWRKYLYWCESKGYSWSRFRIPRILSFLQGLEKGLSASSLKGQISALSILLHKRLADVQSFLSGSH
ncbi:uncharacterized protein LOC128653766 [Bombina bombina]|uniref:uncharacterized protein LOC128653766 n=1 Tax=Bombina bombina TaxID=8345 RepID=UPI00235ABE03|nr:uncharacterized protein LOC128653766 [Bombina bombina]